MRWIRRVALRLRSLTRWHVLDHEMDEELRFHIERQIEQNIARGMAPKEARYAALREFGGVARIQEECRDQRGVGFVETLFRDAAYALRVLRKSPGFTAVAVLSLALGIGANTAIFSLINALLLKSLPVHNPAQLVQFDHANLENEGMTSFPYPFYRDFRDSNTVFSDLMCVSFANTGLRLDGGIERLRGEMVSGNFFQALGVQPHLGRLLVPEDDSAAAAPVVVLSHGFWQRRFGADPALVGQTIQLRDVATTVIGVASPSFHGLDKGSAPEFWAPITKLEQLTGSPYLETRGNWWLQIVGRLKPGVSQEQARGATDAFLLGYLASRGEPTTDHARRVRASERMIMQPISTGMGGAGEKLSTPLLALMAAVCVVLLITCVNIANLLIARGAGRQREIAVRLAIGAGRRRIVRQLLTESFLLAGAVAGVAASYWMVDLLVTYLAGSSAPVDVAPDLRVLAFTLSVSALAGCLFGLAPALHVSRPDLSQALKLDSPQAAGGRALWRQCAVSLQLALALPLLVSAGLFLRTLYNLYTQDMGFVRDNVVQMTLYSGNYNLTAEHNKNYLREVVDRVTAAPGVRGASFAAMAMLGRSMWGSGITVEGVTIPEGEAEPLRNVVGPDFFRTMGTPILLGREFDRRDDERSRKVAIVNESFAKHYFGSENPLGKKIGKGGAYADTEIVGVARDTRYARVREETPRFWYMPYEQVDWKAADLTLHVRTAVDPNTIIPALRDAIQAVDNNIAVDRVTTLESLVEDHLSTERLVATLSSFFGLLAALLASVGLYGVMAYTTQRRRREIGVRLALGAEPARVRRLVLRGAVAQTIAGIAVGVPATLGATLLIESQLFGVEPTDPWTILAATALLALVALIAGYLPAHRASQVNPAIVLRCDG
ncbi:MAG: ABC transporter permease [Bryobacterales bacterium]